MLSLLQSQCTDEYLNYLESDIKQLLDDQLQNPELEPKILYFNDPVKADTKVVVDVGGSTARLSIVENLKVNRIDTVFLNDSQRKDIFNWLAMWLKSHENALPSRGIALTWAFPLENGRITIMGKGFSSERYCNQNVVDVLNDALVKAESVLVCRKAIHDGAACLNAGRVRDPNCMVALTWGSGVNVTFLDSGDRIVNAEVCLLGQNGSYFTAIDTKVDRRLERPGFTPFETMVGGVYLQLLADELDGPADIWAQQRESVVRDTILKRASGFVAAVVGAVLSLNYPNKHVSVACTGGVILFPGVMDLVNARLAKAGHANVALFAEQYGSEVGSAC